MGTIFFISTRVTFQPFKVMQGHSFRGRSESAHETS